MWCLLCSDKFFFRFLQIFLVIFLDIDQNFCFQGELAVKDSRIANKKGLCVGGVSLEVNIIGMPFPSAFDWNL